MKEFFFVLGCFAIVVLVHYDGYRRGYTRGKSDGRSEWENWFASQGTAVDQARQKIWKEEERWP